jgi:hypothetical protein
MARRFATSGNGQRPELIKMSAKFKSKCAETGQTLYKGDPIYYDPYGKKAYHANSNRVQAFLNAPVESFDPGELAADQWYQTTYGNDLHN